RATAQGRLEEALKFLESLRAASPADSTVLTAIGGAYAGLGRHDQAAGVWRSLRDLTGNPKFLSKYADALYESGRHQKALLEYRELFTYGVAGPEQLRRLAELEQNQGSWDQAERILLKLLRTGGTAKDREKLSELLRKMGDLAVQRGNAAEAAQIAQRLLDLRENDPASFVLMGRSKLLQGKFPEAVESFSRAISLAPGDARPLVGLAAAELRRQRPVAAVEYARMAIARDPSLPEAYSILGQAYQRQGKVSEAYAALKSALQNSQNRAGAHIRMGDLFLQHAKYNVALEQFRRAIEIDPRNARARERYAFTLYRLGFSENAMKELLKAIEIDPEGAGSEATALLADIFVAHDEPDRARDLLESVAAKRQAPPGVLIRLGEMYRQNREFSKAVQFFKDALLASEDPRDKYDALNALGMALGDLGDNAAAEKTFREAIGVAPNRPDAFLNLGLVYQDRKEFVPAVDLTRKAIEAAPDRPEGYKLLGLIYYQAGWEEESLSAFRESLKRNPDQPEIAGLVQRIEEPAD
ncbi:tetratricopeptide repeat protein, partial [bacterium]|nr:tetratricopeptide repeat protein [bacterium]